MGWFPSTREWWKRIWKSPMATEWLDADFDTLLRLAYMVDWEARGEGNVTLRRESRLLEDAFGLNPASRARLRWQIGPEGGAPIRELRPTFAACGRSTRSTTETALRLSTTVKELGGEMRTGNAIIDVLIQVVVIAVIAAIIVWILGMVDAPSILATIVWILAALAIVLVLLQLLRGRPRV